MSDPMYAYRTAWAYDPVRRCYILVLENENGEPMACCSYDYEGWMSVFRNIIKCEDERLAAEKSQ